MKLPHEELKSIVGKMFAAAGCDAAEADCVARHLVEANLVGRTGALLNQIWRQIDHSALVLIYDAAN